MASDPRERAGQVVNRGGLAMMLPMTMAISPIVGYFAGQYAGRWLGIEWLPFAGLVLGLVVGIRETVKIIRLLAVPPPGARRGGKPTPKPPGEPPKDA